MLFDSFSDLLRILVVGVCGYVALIILLRVAGKRSLSKLNAFDFVVTIALGSTLSAMILSSEVSLAEGAAAIGLLLGLQAVVSWTIARRPGLGVLVKSEPVLVVRHGKPIHTAMRHERITREELEQAARAAGHGSVADCGAVVLETDGSLSVLGPTDASDHVAVGSQPA